MSSFTTPLEVTPFDEGKRWKLLKRFDYHVGVYPSEVIISVPEGFITDFASVPRILWPIFPPYGRYGKATIIHDFLYLFPEGRSRKDIDNIFLEAMGVLNVPSYQKYVMYEAVRLFGGISKSWKLSHRS